MWVHTVYADGMAEQPPRFDEVPLGGGRVNEGVVRVGDTVRRPVGPHSPFVHELLRHLEQVGFEDAPRFLGVDAVGREIISFLPGAPYPGTTILGDDQIESLAYCADTTTPPRRFRQALGVVPRPSFTVILGRASWRRASNARAVPPVPRC